MDDSAATTGVASFVVHDFVIQEGNCNLSCSYCLTGQSTFKKEHSELTIFKPPRKLSCRPGTTLHKEIQCVLAGAELQDVPVIKISGGEVLLIDGILDLIEELSPRYETVVVLTNGLLLDPNACERLLRLKNVALQVSLDSTRYFGNSYRVATEALQLTTMRRLTGVLCSGLDVEIYTVLNDRSIVDLENTLEDLSRLDSGRIVVFPFPVRGPSCEEFLPRADQHVYLDRVAARFDDFAALLPPRPYFDRLQRFFSDGQRQFRCHLPRLAFGTFDDGSLTSCPNIWFDHVGNLQQEEPATVFSRLAQSRFRSLLLAEHPRIDACRACFSPWDLVSLFFDSEVSLDELARTPVYRGSRTLKRLAELRKRFLQERLTNAQHCHTQS